MLNEPTLPASIVLTERRSGASDHDDKKKTGITRPRPDGGVKKKTGITRPRPDGGVTRKAPRALDPAFFLPPGGVKYATVTQDKSPCLCSERYDEYLFSRAKTGGLGQVTTKKKNHGKKMGITRPRPDGGVTRKAPEALDPTVVLPPPSGGVKYVTVTQDESPWLCSERHGEYFFGRAKTGGLGQVTTKKTRKAPGALTPPLFELPLGSKIYYGHVRYKPKWCKF